MAETTAQLDRRRSALLVVLAASMWGTAGAAQELGAPEVAPWTVAAVRGLVGGLLLLAVAVLLGLWPGVVAVVRRGPRPAAIAAVALSVFQIGYLGGIRLAGVALGTLIAIGSAPVWAGLHAAVTGRPPARRWVVATMLTLTGTGLLVLPAGNGGDVPVGGVLLALAAGAGYATYAIASKRLLDRDLPGFATIAVIFSGVGLILSPLLLLADWSFMATRSGIVGMAWLTVVATAISYALFLRGLAGVDPPTATTLTLAEPLMAALLGIALVGERFTGTALVGALVLAVGLVLIGGPPARVPAAAAGADHGRGTSGH